MTLKEQIESFSLFVAILLGLFAFVGIYAINADIPYERLRDGSQHILQDFVVLHGNIMRLTSGRTDPVMLDIDQELAKIDNEFARLITMPITSKELRYLMEGRIILTRMLLNFKALTSSLSPEEKSKYISRLQHDTEELRARIVWFSNAVTASVLERLSLFRHILIVVFSLVFLLLIMAFVMLERRIATPLFELISQVQEVVSGKRENVSTREGEDEIAELFASISQLVSSRIESMEKIERRNMMLSIINKVSAEALHATQIEELMVKVCDVFIKHRDYRMVWSGKYNEERRYIEPVAIRFKPDFHGTEKDVECMAHVSDINANPALKAAETRKPVIMNDIPGKYQYPQLREAALTNHFTACSAWPLVWKERFYGVLSIYTSCKEGFVGYELKLIENIIADISLGLYSMETREKLHTERDLNREIIDAVNALMVSVSHCGEIVSFNSQAEKASGFSRDEVIGKYWVDVLIQPEDRKEIQTTFSRLLRQGKRDVDFQAKMAAKDGSTRIVNWHASILSDLDRRGLGLVFIGTDVTDLVKTDQALERAIADWDHIFSAIPDPAFVVSRSGVILEANPAACAAADLPRKEVLGRGICRILYGERPANVTCPLDDLIRAGEYRILESEFKGLHGNYELTVSPVPGGNEVEDRTLLVARDLTEEKIRKAEALRAAHLAAVGELAAGVAHEVNNPINGIINYAQIVLDESDDNPVIRDILQRIIKEGNRIAGIVSNLLSFARQKEKLDAEEVNLVEVVEDSIALMKHQLHKDGITLEVDMPPDLPTVMGHAQQLQQVFLNLLSNARYALNSRYPEPDPNKRIEISGRVVEKKGESVVQIEITDYGTGIPQDIADRLFEPFFSTKPDGEGTGLGLSISHGLIREHHGTLKVDSSYGEYTRIVVELPFGKSQVQD